MNWTPEEKLRLLACVDHCQQNSLDLKDALPKMLAHQGFSRGWHGIYYTLRALAGGKKNALTSFRAQGSAFAVLPAEQRIELSTYAAAAATSALAFVPGSPAPSSSTVARASEADRESEASSQDRQPTEVRDLSCIYSHSGSD
jgi:hypothetical protein